MNPLLKNPRMIILAIAVLLALLAISPSLQEGVAIRHVDKDSAASLAGIANPTKNTRPLGYEVITSINGEHIKDIEDYHNAISSLSPNETISIRTSESSYFVVVEPEIEINFTGEQETITRNVTVDNTTQTISEVVNKTISTVIGAKDIGISVTNAPSTNIRKGLDLEGGVRVLLEPSEPVDEEILNQVKEGLEERLNVFGLSDVVIRTSSDLQGANYILIEMAGIQPGEIKDIIEGQGHFEARIANQTAFSGGDDISYVCRSADCSGIDPQRGCSSEGGETFCSFFFSITISPEAAQRQANLTRNLNVITENGNSYLSEKLQLYLDGELVDELNIGVELKGRPSTQIQISGSGFGPSRETAVDDALGNMHQLQAVLETGSLPVSMQIVKIDNLSPILGKEFLESAFIMAIVAILAVGLVVYIRYRTLYIAIPIMLTNVFEIILLLGVAAVFGTNIDLAAIAGIIIVVGTGVDHQIMIADEVRRKEIHSTKQKVKNAFFAITAAFFTTAVAMIPLWFAGAGILKGFAITTLYGITLGVFITRPAFGAVLEYFYKEDK